jgi:SAM-dependent methyltransferase
MRGGSRTAEQLRQHYEIEKELANQLRRATRQERSRLYPALYDELFRRVPHHPQLTRKALPQQVLATVTTQMTLLRPFLQPGSSYLEVGAGDCALALAVAPLVKRVYAIDVSDEITKGLAPPPNFSLLLSDGVSVPVPPSSVQIAYSNQLMEHLHPEDALEQLQNIARALAPGGLYLCVTPNRLTGPHDISRYFDRVATGFHLKEYTLAELSHLFQQVGLTPLGAYWSARGRHLYLEAAVALRCEQIAAALPAVLRQHRRLNLPLRFLLGNVRLLGRKDV